MRGSGGAESGGMFLRSAIEKILADRDIRRHSQLKKACENALAELDAELGKGEEEVESPKGEEIVPARSALVSADRFFLPFELACKSASPRIVVTALDCLQKLIAYGHLSGTSRDPADPSSLLIDRIISAICGCFQGPQTNEDVQLQVIKALLTAVITKKCEVHEGSLLAAVKTCYNLFLVSRNQINQATAKASLTQMLNAVFARMERERWSGEADAERTVEGIVAELVAELVDAAAGEAAGGDEPRQGHMVYGIVSLPGWSGSGGAGRRMPNGPSRASSLNSWLNLWMPLPGRPPVGMSPDKVTWFMG